MMTHTDGGDGDDDDALNLDTAAGAVTVNLQSSTITGYGGTIHYQDLQTINANVSGQNLTVNATAGDDTVEVTPLTATSGVLQANGVDPVLNYSNLGATFLVDLLSGGEDRLGGLRQFDGRDDHRHADDGHGFGPADQLRQCGSVDGGRPGRQRHVQRDAVGDDRDVHRRRRSDRRVCRATAST